MPCCASSLPQPKPVTTKQKQAKEIEDKKKKEDERRKYLASLPKTIEEAEKKVEEARATKDPNKIKKAEEDHYRLRREAQKQEELKEWQTERKEELRQQYRHRQQRRERWDLWAAANPKAAKIGLTHKQTTNYEAWDNWEPEDEWDDMKDELMPEDKPELKARRQKHCQPATTAVLYSALTPMARCAGHGRRLQPPCQAPPRAGSESQRTQRPRPLSLH